MTTRSLRTGAVANPKTTGQRIRNARIACGLTQEQLARGISKVTKTEVSKAHVSHWESGRRVKAPSHVNLNGIRAVTGFAVEWLATGKGDPQATVESDGLDIARLQLVLEAMAPDTLDAAREARIIALLYKALTVSPSMSPQLLAEFAQNIK